MVAQETESLKTQGLPSVREEHSWARDRSMRLPDFFFFKQPRMYLVKWVFFWSSLPSWKLQSVRHCCHCTKQHGAVLCDISRACGKCSVTCSLMAKHWFLKTAGRCLEASLVNKLDSSHTILDPRWGVAISNEPELSGCQLAEGHHQRSTAGTSGAVAVSPPTGFPYRTTSHLSTRLRAFYGPTA